MIFLLLFLLLFPLPVDMVDSIEWLLVDFSLKERN